MNSKIAFNGQRLAQPRLDRYGQWGFVEMLKFTRRRPADLSALGDWSRIRFGTRPFHAYIDSST